ncbi:hypothetical protein C0J52_03708 [Blattella germanica]|nr:hypothetical protein C0J52_03708 [Blattella germanica]
MFHFREFLNPLIIILFCFNTTTLYKIATPSKHGFTDISLRLTSALSQMTKEIVSRYFSTSRCILVVIEEPSDGETVEDSIPGSLQRFNVHFREEMIEYKLVEDIMLKALDDKCLGYIFMVSDPVQIVISMKTMYRKTKQRANGKFLFLPKGSGFDSAIDDVLQMKEMDFFPDLVMAKFLLDTNEGAFLLSANIYPDKVSNLMGKSLTAATFTYQPYAIVNLETSPITFDGTETRVFLEFCKLVNASFRVSVDAENEWGEIYENCTGNGILGYSTMWNCVFNSLGLLVLQTPPDERTTNRLIGPNRHVLVWLTIMFLLITTSYSSGLASILTVPRFEPPIDTVSDLAYSKFLWGATHLAWVFSLREAHDPRTVLLLSHFQVLKASSLSKHAAVGDFAFSIERLPAGHYAIGEYITEVDASTRLRLMKEDIYHEHVPTISPKGSPYMTKLNKLILRLRAVSHSRENVDLGPTKLQVRHIEGGVYMLALGLALSFLAFIAELIYYNCSTKLTGRTRIIVK